MGHQASAYNPNPGFHPSLQKPLGFTFYLFFFNHLSPKKRPLKQTTPKKKKKAPTLLRQSTRMSPAAPTPGHVRARHHCSVSKPFYRPVLTAGPREGGESPALPSQPLLARLGCGCHTFQPAHSPTRPGPAPQGLGKLSPSPPLPSSDSGSW